MRLIVIGGGAAGFFCAVNAARMAPALQVIILEKSRRLLSKVRISGGGRCNLTHDCQDITEMSKRYPRGKNFVKKAFHRFFTYDTIQWFESRGVALKSEADGRMFPVSDSSQSVIDCLLKEAARFHIDILMNREVTRLFKNEEQWKIELSGGEVLSADFICIATGGYPKGTMFQWMKDTGHSLEEPVPSLFTFNMPGSDIRSLMGVSVPMASVKIMGTNLIQEGPLLITHWGLSGPVILKLSAWGARDLKDMGYEFDIQVNWLNGYHEQSFREALIDMKETNHRALVGSKSFPGIPQRLWTYFLEHAGIDTGKKWVDLPLSLINRLAKLICSGEFRVKGKTTFKEEFVTAGGVKLVEIDANRMESKLHKNLFFAGEVMDVDGITGGYNFQFAWTSGYIAAKSIAAEIAV